LVAMADVDMGQNRIVELLMMTVALYLVVAVPAVAPADRMAVVAAQENQVVRAESMMSNVIIQDVIV